MEKAQLHIAMLGILLLTNTIRGGCFPSNEERNWTLPWPSDFYSRSIEASTSQATAPIVYIANYVWPPRDGNNFYGVEATLDVYGFTLKPGQISQAAISIVNRGDGKPSSMSGFKVGWHISPSDYKDSKTHFYIDWTDCLNMECPGFRKTSSSRAPGDVIDPVSNTNGNKQYITLRIFKEKLTGDWHIHYGFNGAPQPVGYFPKSLIPGLRDKSVEISFGGLVSHRKPQPSPPMGNSYLPATTCAASFSGLKLIDEDGNDHVVNGYIPTRVSQTLCYFISGIGSIGRFYYGGAGCYD